MAADDLQVLDVAGLRDDGVEDDYALHPLLFCLMWVHRGDLMQRVSCNHACSHAHWSDWLSGDSDHGWLLSGRIFRNIGGASSCRRTWTDRRFIVPGRACVSNLKYVSGLPPPKR